MKKLKKLFIVMLLFAACKKETIQPTITGQPLDWNGGYALIGSSCSDSLYNSSESGNMTISNNVIAAYGLSSYLYNPAPITINGSTATIAPDNMETGDHNANFNSWDMLGGTASLSGNTITISYSFNVYYNNGTLKSHPVFNSIYRK